MWPVTAFALLLSCLSADSVLADLDAALASKDTQQVRSIEQRLLSGNESADTLLSAGALLARHDLLADAAAVFQQCAQQFPALFEAKYNLALTRIGLDDYPAAERILHTMSPGSAPETSAVQYLQGKIYSATGRVQEARLNLENAYRSNPGDENYALDLALLYIRSSAYVPAIQVLQPSLALHPESEDLALELALSDALAGKQADSLAVCHKLTERNPGLSTPRVIAAFANCAAASYQACEAEAAAGLALPHPDSYLYYLHAEALWNSGGSELSKILSELGVAIDKMPACGVCYLLRSRAREAANDDRAAISDLKAALGQEAQSAQAWYRLSVLYRKAGSLSEADDALRHYRAVRDRQASEEIESFRKQLVGSLNNSSSQ
jgi:tetratricopeptide (TPR) repeat protein